MTDDLRELYQSVILDHNKKPRNSCVPDGANRSANGVNPLCGDKVTIHLTVEDGVVIGVGFTGTGCAISTASASLMTQSIKGKTVDEIQGIFDDFHSMVTSNPKAEMPSEALGKLTVLAGVREFPMRIKCATLAWHAMRAALCERGETATTE